MTFDKNLYSFLVGYLECAQWSSTNDNGEPIDRLGLDFTKDAYKKAEKDCKAFCDAWSDLLYAANPDYSRHGHDFWLTRNRHGAGFWDRDYGQLGEDLSEAAKKFGEVNVQVVRKRLVFYP